MNTFDFRWETGHIEIPAENITLLAPAKLKALVKSADANRAEVVRELAAYLESLISSLDTEREWGKKQAEKLEALLFAATGKRQTAQEKAIRRIIKGCDRPDMAGAFTNSGMQCITDGKRLVRLHKPLDLPTATGTLDAAGIISASDFSVGISLPTLKDLKVALSLAKKGVESEFVHVMDRRPVYCFGDGMPIVHAAHLVDMLEALPGCTAACSVQGLVYFSAPCGDGVLMPIRPHTKDCQAQKAADRQAEIKARQEQRETSEHVEREKEAVERAARIAPLEGYLDTLSPAQAGRAEKYLLDKQIRYNGVIMAIYEYIHTLLEEGHIPEVQENVVRCKRGGKTTIVPVEYIMRKPGKNYYYAVKKTEFNFALYLFQNQKGCTAEPEITSRDTEELDCLSASDTNSTPASTQAGQIPETAAPVDTAPAATGGAAADTQLDSTRGTTISISGLVDSSDCPTDQQPMAVGPESGTAAESCAATMEKVPTVGAEQPTEAGNQKHQPPERDSFRRSRRSFSSFHSSAGFPPTRREIASRSRAVSAARIKNSVSVSPVAFIPDFTTSANSRGRSGRSPPSDLVANSVSTWSGVESVPFCAIAAPMARDIKAFTDSPRSVA